MRETRRKQKNDMLASWDPTRLLQDTEGRRRRLISVETKNEPKRNFILQSGGLAKVSWRAGL